MILHIIRRLAYAVIGEPMIIRIANDGIVPRLNDLELARDYAGCQLQSYYCKRY